MTTPTITEIAATVTGIVADNPPPAATTTAMAKMPAMMGSNHVPGTCRISMLWNWYTIDSCFIARSWHNRTRGAFAGSCIGVILICILLELTRRAQREYDRSLVRNFERNRVRNIASVAGTATLVGTTPAGTATLVGTSPATTHQDNIEAAVAKDGALVLGRDLLTPLSFKPSLFQQIIRTLFYVLQFAAAYLIMLLAMYYNGYIIICILIGVFIGHLFFGYDNITIGGKQETGTSCC